MKERRGVWLAGAVAMAFAAAVSQGFAQEGGARGKGGRQAEEENKPPEDIFEPLVQTLKFIGPCEARNPDAGVYAPPVAKKLYPLGTAFRTGAGGTLVLAFSANDTVTLTPGSEVVVTAAKGNPKARTVRLVSGKIRTDLRDNLPEGSFNVLTENAVSKGLSGRGEYSLKRDADLETFQAATITGAAAVEGPNYTIPALRAANTVDIETSPGRSLSRLTSVSGEFTVKLESGGEEPVSYVMSPKAVVKIWRKSAPVGGRTLVSVLALSHQGITQHRFAYAMGRPLLATGELVKQPEKAGDAEPSDAPAPGDAGQ